MSIVDELKARGASDDYCVYVERLTAQDFTLAELVLPLVPQLGYQAAVNKRLASKVLQLERELEVKNKRLADWLKEKLEREGVNQRKNQYVTQLREWLARAEKEAADTKRAYDALKGRMSCAEKEAADAKRAYDELKSSTFVERYGVDGAELASRHKTHEAKPEQPYVRYQDKKSWAVGDKVRISDQVKGEVHSVSFRAGRVQSANIQVPSKMPGVRELHWLTFLQRYGCMMYLGQSTLTRE